MPRVGKQNLPRENNLVSFRIPDKVLEKLKAIQGKRSLGATCQDALIAYFGLDDEIESEEKKKDFNTILSELLEEKLIRIFNPRITKLEQEIHHLKKQLHLHLNPNLEERDGIIQKKIIIIDNPVDNPVDNPAKIAEIPTKKSTTRKPKTRKQTNAIDNTKTN